MKSIVLIIPYFGQWPEWFSIYLASCKANPTVNWHLFTDCPLPASFPSNVKFTITTFNAYKQRVRDRLGILFDPTDPYKLCDIKPALGAIHEEDIAGFDYFGWGDIDVVYGNIRKFYSEEVLTHHIISTVEWGVSGHFTLVKNERWLKQAFRKLPGWKRKFCDPKYLRMDEWHFGLIFLPNKNPILKMVDKLLNNKYKQNNYFKEQYTTPLTFAPWHDGFKNHPETWCWKDGRVTNDRDGEREFIYFHFMNYKFARWMDPKYGAQAPWQGLSKLVHLDYSQIDKGVRIDRWGFHAQFA